MIELDALFQHDKEIVRLFSEHRKECAQILKFALRVATKKIARDVTASAKQHSYSGQMAKAIGTKQKVYRRTGVIFNLVGVRKGFFTVTTPQARGDEMFPRKKPRKFNPTHYMHLLELGVRPHKVRSKYAPRPKSALQKTARSLFGKIVKHPGFAGKKILAAAYAKNANYTLSTIRDAIRQQVAKKLGYAA